jgi:hypothetical protein
MRFFGEATMRIFLRFLNISNGVTWKFERFFNGIVREFILPNLWWFLAL